MATRAAKSNRFRLAKQQICTNITLFCSFPCNHCTTTKWKMPKFTFCRGCEHKATTFFFFSWTLKNVLENSNLEIIANIWRIRGGICAIKFEAIRLYYLSDVFVFVSCHRHCCLSSLLKNKGGRDGHGEEARRKKEKRRISLLPTPSSVLSC